MWNNVNTLLSTGIPSYVQSRFEIDGLEKSDSSLIALKFNEYVASVGSNLAANFDDEYSTDNYLKILGERLEISFFSLCICN